MVGGAASRLGGGTFENGAVTAAFGYLFNDMAHEIGDPSAPPICHDCSAPGVGRSVLGDFIPLTGAADRAVDFWITRDNPFMGTLAMSWTPDHAPGTALALSGAGAGNVLAKAAGPFKQWLRFGPSYSRAGGFEVEMSIRWGASPVGGGKYVNQIPSQTMRDFNQWLRSTQAPFGGWRAADPGHFHLWR
jgi:hypothetical protein